MGRYKDNEFCPLIRKECMRHECKFFVGINGTDPNTGVLVQHDDCTVAWLPKLLIDNSKEQRHTGAAIESFRNEMVKSNESPVRMLLENMITKMVEQGEIELVPTDDDDEDDGIDSELSPRSMPPTH